MAENVIKIEGVIPTGGQLPVTGTVVATPSGTQVVSGTVTTVPSGTQTVSGTVTSTPSGTQNVAITGQPINMVMTANTSSTPLYTVAGMPAGVNLYSTLVFDTLGVVAANNFLSVFNPIGSGKTLVFYQFTCFPWATAATSATVSMLVFRTTAASAGTLVAAANVGKFSTASPNSVAEVRTGNPTTTNATVPILAIPPAVTAAPTGIGSVASIVPPTGASFVCAPGEGVVARTTAGAIGQLWDMGFTWSEQ